MNNEINYDKYYQKGGNYVLPTEVFNELLYENQQLKEKIEMLKQADRNTYESAQDMLSELDIENQQLKEQLQQRMNLYNYVIDLKQALNEIKEYVKSDKALIGCDENDKELFLRDYICCNKILQIIDKVGGK